MSDMDVRWRQRLDSFRKAFAQLREAAALARKRPLTSLEQQGLIQAFEFTHELAWNTLKDYLQAKGNPTIHGSKDATREAFARGIIDDGTTWMEMIASRNQTSHTYNQTVADAIAGDILSRYVDAFSDFLQRFDELERTAK